MSEKIQLNEKVIKGQIKKLVRGSVEEALNELLEKKAESLTQAARYERSEVRRGYSLEGLPVMDPYGQVPTLYQALKNELSKSGTAAFFRC